MTDSAQLYKYRLGDFASHDRVDHSKDEYARYEEGRPVIHTNTRRELLLACSSAACAAPISTARKSTCTAILAEFDFRFNNRSRLGVEDRERAKKAVVGAKGKRLTYRTTGSSRSDA